MLPGYNIILVKLRQFYHVKLGGVKGFVKKYFACKISVFVLLAEGQHYAPTWCAPILSCAGANVKENIKINFLHNPGQYARKK
jgi:hypothetical protein